MAANKVILEFMGQNADALKAARELKQSIEAAGYSLDDLHKKGKQASGGLGDDFTKLFKDMGGGAAAISAVWKALSENIAQVDKQIAALNERQQAATEVSRRYGEGLGKIYVNMPNETPQAYAAVDALLRKTASENALGSGGLNKLTDAYTTIQSSISTTSDSVKADALTQTAKMLRLSPTDDASGIALGVSKIIETGKGQISGDQALNMLRAQQTRSLVTTTGPIGRGIPTLAAAGEMGGLPLSDMQALSAYFTQAIGDTEGSETITAVAATINKLMTRGAKIGTKLGTDVPLQGNALERLEQISTIYRSGQLSEQEIGLLLPDLTRSEKGKMGVVGMLNKGVSVLDENRAFMRDAMAASYSWTDRDYENMIGAVPAQKAHDFARARESRKEVKQASNAAAAMEQELRAEFEQQLKQTGRGADYVSAALSTFDLARFSGRDVQSASALAVDSANRTMLPLVGGAMTLANDNVEKMFNQFANDPRAGAYRRKTQTSDAPTRSEDELLQEIRWLRQDFRIGGAPRRPLKETGAR